MASAIPAIAFLLNGVDASNLFNGKSTSQVASARIVNNTGVAERCQHQRELQFRAPRRLLGDRPGFAHACARNGHGTSRQHLDVRRAARFYQRRSHRHEHRLRHERHSRQWLRSSRHGLAERRAVFLQAGSQHSRQRKGSAVASLYCRRNAWAGRSSRTNYSVLSAISTFMTPTRRSDCRACWSPFGLTDRPHAGGTGARLQTRIGVRVSPGTAMSIPSLSRSSTTNYPMASI